MVRCESAVPGRPPHATDTLLLVLPGVTALAQYRTRHQTLSQYRTWHHAPDLRRESQGQWQITCFRGLHSGPLLSRAGSTIRYFSTACSYHHTRCPYGAASTICRVARRQITGQAAG
eukprot:3938088-Rhodomonas_salina.1